MNAFDNAGSLGAEGENRDELVRTAPHAFRVHTRAYTDAEVFAREQKQIFGKIWVYVGHESEIPAAYDWKTSHIGTQPIIVTRDQEGRLGAFLNRCAHRGASICREAKGNSKSFTCPYHAWTYGIDGKLTGIPYHHEPNGYSEHFQMPEGLYRIPKVESYRGFIFASLNSKVQPLLDQLGTAKLMIDRRVERSPVGELVLRSVPYVARFKGNWKFQSENIVDGYHFIQTHYAFVKLQEKYQDTTGDFGVHKGASISEMRKHRIQGTVYGCPQGHGINFRRAANIDDLVTGEYADYHKELRALRGEEEFGWIIGTNAASIFPNMGMIHQQIRTWRPVSPDVTEVRIYLYDVKGAPDRLNEGWLRSQERFYGPAGHGMADDVEMFAVNQQGLEASAMDWLILDRGIDQEKLLDNGDYEGMLSSETAQRAFWRRYSKLMEQA